MAERTRGYALGSRKKSLVKGVLSKSRLAWTKIYLGQVNIWADFYRNEENEDLPLIADIKLMLPTPSGSVFTLNLSACTEEELMALKRIFDTGIEWALPFCKQRDKEAKDAFDNGDDSHSRIYRQVPQLVYRARPEWEHSEGLQYGPEDAPKVLNVGERTYGELSRLSPVLAKCNTSNGRPEDDGEETD